MIEASYGTLAEFTNYLSELGQFNEDMNLLSAALYAETGVNSRRLALSAVAKLAVGGASIACHFTFHAF